MPYTKSGRYKPPRRRRFNFRMPTFRQDVPLVRKVTGFVRQAAVYAVAFAIITALIMWTYANQ